MYCLSSLLNLLDSFGPSSSISDSDAHQRGHILIELPAPAQLQPDKRLFLGFLFGVVGWMIYYCIKSAGKQNILKDSLTDGLLYSGIIKNHVKQTQENVSHPCHNSHNPWLRTPPKGTGVPRSIRTSSQCADVQAWTCKATSLSPLSSGVGLFKSKSRRAFSYFEWIRMYIIFSCIFNHFLIS